jgi:hypothetical protein
MSDLFSEEMKKELVKLIDSRLEIIRIFPTLDMQSKLIKEINDRLVDVEDNYNDFENDIHNLQEDIKETIKGEDLEDLVGQTMLRLMPNFNEKISKEIKKHLVAIAEFVIKNFKEKE